MANLTRLKMLESFDGVVLTDKPAGVPFASVVKAFKRKYNIEKVGHGGSLDPGASGLLVLLINGANSRTGDVMGADRSWEGTFRLGLKTDTNDVHGSPLPGFPVSGPVPPPERIAAAAAELKGDVFLVESGKCSVRREGSASWEVADTGVHKPFLAHVYRFDPAPTPEDGATALPASLRFSLRGTKGVIVRSLADAFGDALGCGASLETCRRTAVGHFSVADAVPLARLLDPAIDDFRVMALPMSKAFAR